MDEAGNDFTTEFPSIQVDTRTPGARFVLNRTAFSPNDDGIADVLDVAIEVDDTQGLMNWDLEIVSVGQKDGTQKTQLRTADSPSAPPSTFQFDGKRNGTTFADGAYRIELALEYENGWKTVKASDEFIIDTRPPYAKASCSRSYFNPRGTASQSSITISQEGTQERLWTAEIRDAQGKIFRRWEFNDAAPSEIVWDGHSIEGAPVPDGIYTYRLLCVDEAGNSFASEPIAIGIETSPKQASILADIMAISPNGDDIQDVMTFTINAAALEYMQSWRFAILAGNEAVREWTGTGKALQSIIWDGTSTVHLPVPDGSYTAVFSANYVNGDVIEAHSGSILVDRVAPQAKVELGRMIFSPNGDGVNDTLPIEQESVPGDVWEGSIVDNAGKVVRNWKWEGVVRSFEWDGSDGRGM